MSSKEHLIEQHILEYESRMRHIDELYQRAHEAVAEKPESERSWTTVWKPRPPDWRNCAGMVSLCRGALRSSCAAIS